MVLNSRPLESCHHQCLKVLCGVLGYPKGSALELLDGTLKLRHCTNLFTRRFPPWSFPKVGSGAGTSLSVTTDHLLDSGSTEGKKVRLTKKTRPSASSHVIPHRDPGHSTPRRWKRLRPPFLRRSGGKGGRASQSFSSPWGWVILHPGDAWNLHSEAAGVVGTGWTVQPKGPAHWRRSVLISASHWRAWTDTHVIYHVRTTTTRRPRSECRPHQWVSTVFCRHVAAWRTRLCCRQAAARTPAALVVETRAADRAYGSGRGTAPLLRDLTFEARHEGGGGCQVRRLTRPEDSHQSRRGWSTKPYGDRRDFPRGCGQHFSSRCSRRGVWGGTSRSIWPSLLAPLVQIQDAPVPQLGEQLVDIFNIFRLTDTQTPVEQVHRSA